MKSNLFKIKEGKAKQWKDWCSKLASVYREEALVTLEEEKVIQEMFLFFSLNKEDYVVSFIEGLALPSTDRQLNIEHRKNFKECLEKVSSVEVLYNLKIQE